MTELITADQFIILSTGSGFAHHNEHQYNNNYCQVSLMLF